VLLPLCAVTAAACSSGGSDEGASATAASTVGSTAAPAGTTTAAAPVTVAPVPLSSRLAAEIPIRSADWLAVGPEGLWVKRDDGSLTLVDTATNEVVDTVEIGGEGFCQGLGVAGDGGVWTCSGDDVVRYDPAARSVDRRWTNGKVSDQGQLHPIDGRIWVGTGDSRTLAGLDPVGTTPDISFVLPVRVSDVGVCDDELWVTSQGESRVLRIDPVTGDVLVDAPLDGARALACAGDVWAVGAREAVRLDPTSGARLAEVPIADGGDGVAIGEGSVWVRATSPFLTRIDRDSGEVIETFSSPEAPSIGDIVVTAGSVWTTASDHDVLFRLSGET
jgi:hypothetical protein